MAPPTQEADTAAQDAAARAHEAGEPTGTRIDRYILLGKVGQGAMGEVYTAFDPTLDRKVAVKLVRKEKAQSNAARGRLLREAKALARLSHPNVVAVYGAGTIDDDQVFIAMEYVDGITLTEWQGQKARHWREILDDT